MSFDVRYVFNQEKGKPSGKLEQLVLLSATPVSEPGESIRSAESKQRSHEGGATESPGSRTRLSYAQNGNSLTPPGESVTSLPRHSNPTQPPTAEHLQSTRDTVSSQQAEQLIDQLETSLASLAEEDRRGRRVRDYLAFVGNGLTGLWLVMWDAHVFCELPIPGEPEVFTLVAALDIWLTAPALIGGVRTNLA